jgi:hypothetical protein
MAGTFAGLADLEWTLFAARAHEADPGNASRCWRWIRGMTPQLAVIASANVTLTFHCQGESAEAVQPVAAIVRCPVLALR